jgi:hypothetical protein
LLPILAVVGIFQLLVIQQPFPDLANLLTGIILVTLGLTLFMYGLELALFPIGDSMAYAFARKGSVFWLVIFAFALGFGTTIAEPALLAVSVKAASIAAEGGAIINSQTAQDSYALGLRLTVAFAVGLAIIIGVLRILRGWSLQYLIIAGYLGIIIMTRFAPPEIIGIAYDSGGITTSTITVPLVTALGIGLASSIQGGIPVRVGFGLNAVAA